MKINWIDLPVKRRRCENNARAKTTRKRKKALMGLQSGSSRNKTVNHHVIGERHLQFSRCRGDGQVLFSVFNNQRNNDAYKHFSTADCFCSQLSSIPLYAVGACSSTLSVAPQATSVVHLNNVSWAALIPMRPGPWRSQGALLLWQSDCTVHVTVWTLSG